MKDQNKKALKRGALALVADLGKVKKKLRQERLLHDMTAAELDDCRHDLIHAKQKALDNEKIVKDLEAAKDFIELSEAKKQRFEHNAERARLQLLSYVEEFGKDQDGVMIILDDRLTIALGILSNLDAPIE